MVDDWISHGFFSSNHLTTVTKESKAKFWMVMRKDISDGNRTHSLRIRSPARYPLRHGVYCDLRQFKDVWSFEAICVMFWAFFSQKTPSHLNSKHLLLNTSFRSNTRRKLFRCDHLSIAQLVERRTVVGNTKQRSLGHWFKSGSREVFFSKTTPK